MNSANHSGHLSCLEQNKITGQNLTSRALYGSYWKLDAGLLVGAFHSLGWAAGGSLYCCQQHHPAARQDTLVMAKNQLKKWVQKAWGNNPLAFSTSSKFLNPPPPAHPTNMNRGMDGMTVRNILSGASAPISDIHC